MIGSNISNESNPTKDRTLVKRQNKLTRIPRQGEEVLIHFSLHTGEWCVKTRNGGKWSVTHYAASCSVTGATPALASGGSKLTTSGVDRIRKNGAREVVLAIRGRWNGDGIPSNVQRHTDRLRFNPFHNDTFQFQGRDWKGGDANLLMLFEVAVDFDRRSKSGAVARPARVL